jgi:hypothetical protein
MPKKLYLQPKELVRHSRYHTTYVGDGAIKEDGATRVYSTVFINGIARNVDESMARRLKDAGLADVSRPRINDDEDD